MQLGGGGIIKNNIRYHNTLPHNGHRVLEKAIPFVGMQVGRFSIAGPGVTFALVRSPFLGVKLLSSWDKQYEYRGPGMSKRRWSVNGGFEINMLYLRASFQHDVLGRSNGSIYNVSLGHRLLLSSQWMLGLSAGIEHLSERYMNYYFGVKTEETSFFEAYHAQRESNYYTRCSITFLLDKYFSLASNVGYKRYGNRVFFSPTVRKRDEYTFMLTGVFSLSI